MEHYQRRVTGAAALAFQDDTSKLTRDYLAMQDQLAAVATELLRARKARVDELLEKERFAARLAQLLQVLPGAVIVLDRDGIVVECNTAAVDLLGRPLVGQTWSEIVARITGPCAASRGELRLRDGRCLSLARRTLEQENGEIMLLMDISEAERLQAIVQRQNRLSAMGEMTARLAHQIRTPLTSALLYLSQLEHGGAIPSDGDGRFLQKSLQRLRDLESLVDDMLIFAGGVNDAQEDVDLADCVARVVETARPQVADSIGIRVEVTATDNRIIGHAAAIQSAVLNLLMNAVAVSPVGTDVVITVDSSIDEVKVSVRDHGPGVPVEFHDRLFEPFFSTRSQGTGLGLAVVNSVAQAHGGRVAIHDLPDGAEFVILLPRTVAIAQTPLASTSLPIVAESHACV